MDIYIEQFGKIIINLLWFYYLCHLPHILYDIQLASHKLQHDGSHPHPTVHPRSSDENARENENFAIKNSNEI